MTDSRLLDPNPSFSLGRLVAAWAERGAALPVAVVVSVFDDLLEDAPSFPHALSRIKSNKPLGLEDIAIDPAGVARLRSPVDDVVSELSRLLRDALASNGEDSIPAAAQPLLRHAMSEDRWVRPADPDVLRQWLRKALGPPAPHQEVCSVIEAVSGPPLMVPPLAVPSVVPEERPLRSSELAPAFLRSVVSAETAAASALPSEVEIQLLSAIDVPAASSTGGTAARSLPPLEVPELVPPVEADQAATEMVAPRLPSIEAALPSFHPPLAASPAPAPAPAPAPSAARPPSVPAPPISRPQPAAPPTVMADQLSEPPPLLPRATVRVSSRKTRPVSLPAAPPARLGSVRLESSRHDHILVPTASPLTFWLRALFLVGAAVGLLLLLRS